MNVAVWGAVAAGLAALGVYFIYTSVAFRWDRPKGPGLASVSMRTRLGLADVNLREMVGASAALWVLGAAGAYLLFGGLLPSIVAGCFIALTPAASYRARRRAAMAAAAEAWPRMLEELRLRTGSLGQSVPQALFEAGRRAPQEWRSGFAAAEREWLLTTDFSRTVALLKDRLSDATVDVVCETLVVAHEVGGSELDSKLAELIEDRNIDLQGRKDAASRQAGVRFARRFVLLVPLGMALAGLTIGTGRQAYETTGGQTAVAAGLVAVAACWMWSGRLMRLPDEPRVFE